MIKYAQRRLQLAAWRSWKRAGPILHQFGDVEPRGHSIETSCCYTISLRSVFLVIFFSLRNGAIQCWTWSEVLWCQRPIFVVKLPSVHTIFSTSAPPLIRSCPFFTGLGASSTYQTFQSGCLSAVLTLDEHRPVVRITCRGLSLHRIHFTFPRAFRSPRPFPHAARSPQHPSLITQAPSNLPMRVGCKSHSPHGAPLTYAQSIDLESMTSYGAPSAPATSTSPISSFWQLNLSTAHLKT